MRRKGIEDYVWTFNTGAMVLYPNKGMSYVTDGQSMWEGSSTIWDPSKQ